MGEGGEITLFGVRLVVDSLRKSVSLNNLSQYALPPSSSAAVDATTGGGGGGGGYASADEALPCRSFVSRSERKRGVAWTEEEHKLFLMGLKRVGKGDWRGISRNYVKTRTPTQVASHAQKYFLRHTNHNRRRRRTSLFDITTDTVSTNHAEEEQAQDQDKNKTGIQSQTLPPETSNIPNFSMLQPFPATSTTTATPVLVVSQAEKLLPVVQDSEATNPSTSTMLLFPMLPLPCASPVRDLNLDLNLRPIPEPLQLSLNLSLASDKRESIISVS